MAASGGHEQGKDLAWKRSRKGAPIGWKVVYHIVPILLPSKAVNHAR